MQVALGALQKFVLELAELSSVFSHLTGAGDSTSHTLYTLILSFYLSFFLSICLSLLCSLFSLFMFVLSPIRIILGSGTALKPAHNLMHSA